VKEQMRILGEALAKDEVFFKQDCGEFIGSDQVLGRDLTKEEIAKNYKIITCLTLSSTSKSIHFLPTMRSINSYLLKNRDSLLDSSTIKEMIHKSCTDLYESVLKSIKIPYYLGFLGTFSILILGIFTISMQTQEIITLNDISSYKDYRYKKWCVHTLHQSINDHEFGVLKFEFKFSFVT
jgi:hypothetical protein